MAEQPLQGSASQVSLLRELREIATDFALTDHEAVRDIIVRIDVALEEADG